MGVQVKFWGVRGSAACATPEFSLYGGQTSCVSVETDGGVIIFDAGSGLKDAGTYFAQKQSSDIHLFLSHAHLDHVMGFPFFMPFWMPQVSTTVYGAQMEPYGGIGAVVKKFLSPPIFPISPERFPGRISYRDLQIGASVPVFTGAQMTTAALHHPNEATGYRLSMGGKSICYVTDAEHFEGGPDANILGLIKDADLFIYDSTFSDEEYPRHVNWGHSTWQEGIRLANEANVKQLVIFHHHPNHTDEMMAQVEMEALQQRPGGVVVARQGMLLTL